MFPKKTMIYKILADFVFGGLLISLALYISEILGPLLAGEFASLPIRTGTTLFIAGTTGGVEAMHSMSVGALTGSLGAFAFTIILCIAPRKIGTFHSFLIAFLACIAVVYLTNPILSAIFP